MVARAPARVRARGLAGRRRLGRHRSRRRRRDRSPGPAVRTRAAPERHSIGGLPPRAHRDRLERDVRASAGRSLRRGRKKTRRSVASSPVTSRSPSSARKRSRRSARRRTSSRRSCRASSRGSRSRIPRAGSPTPTKPHGARWGWTRPNHSTGRARSSPASPSRTRTGRRSARRAAGRVASRERREVRRILRYRAKAGFRTSSDGRRSWRFRSSTTQAIYGSRSTSSATSPRSD
jgi:hypothetical protein